MAEQLFPSNLGIFFATVNVALPRTRALLSPADSASELLTPR
jgi:hypothetical protein